MFGLASNGGASTSDACSSVTWSNNFLRFPDTCGATGSSNSDFLLLRMLVEMLPTTSATFTIIDDTRSSDCYILGLDLTDAM